MSGRGHLYESLYEFSERRFRELARIPEFGKMDAHDLFDLIEVEFYECANDPIPPYVEPVGWRRPTLQ